MCFKTTQQPIYRHSSYFPASRQFGVSGVVGGICFRPSLQRLRVGSSHPLSLHGAYLPWRKSRLSAARMSGAVVDLVCSDQLSRGLRAWQARSRHATGERIGDCDLMRSTSASCARQRWSGNARSMTSVKRAAGTALSVVVVLFGPHKSLRNHRDTRTLEQFAILSRTISCLLYTSPSPRDATLSRMPSSA